MSFRGRSSAHYREAFHVFVFLSRPLWAALPTQQQLNDVASCRSNGSYVDLTSVSYDASIETAPMPPCVSTCPAGSVSFPGSCIAQEAPVASGVRFGLTFLVNCVSNASNGACAWVANGNLLGDAMLLRISQLLGGVPSQELRGSHITLPTSSIELQGIFIARRGEPGFSSRRLNDMETDELVARRSLSSGSLVYIVTRADTRRLASDSPVVQQLLNGNTSLVSWFLGLPASIFNATLLVGLPSDGAGDDADYQLAIGFKGLPWTTVGFAAPSTWTTTTLVTTTRPIGFLSQGSSTEEDSNSILLIIILVLTLFICMISLAICLLLLRRSRARLARSLLASSADDPDKDVLGDEPIHQGDFKIGDDQVPEYDFTDTDEYPDSTVDSEAPSVWQPSTNPGTPSMITTKPLTPMGPRSMAKASTPLGVHSTVYASTPLGPQSTANASTPLGPHSTANASTPLGPSTTTIEFTPPGRNPTGGPSTPTGAWDEQVTTPTSEAKVPTTPTASWSRNVRTPKGFRAPRTPKKGKSAKPTTPRQTEPTIPEQPELEEEQDSARNKGLDNAHNEEQDSARNKGSDNGAGLFGLYSHRSGTQHPDEKSLGSPRSGSIPPDTARVQGVAPTKLPAMSPKDIPAVSPKDNQPSPRVLGSTPDTAPTITEESENGSTQPNTAPTITKESENGSTQQQPMVHHERENESARQPTIDEEGENGSTEQQPIIDNGKEDQSTRQPTIDEEGKSGSTEQQPIIDNGREDQSTRQPDTAKESENESTQRQVSPGPSSDEPVKSDRSDPAVESHGNDGSQGVPDVNALEAELHEMRTKPLEERKQFFRQQCLRCHPDKNLQDKEMAGQAFQYLQSKKDWFLSESYVSAFAHRRGRAGS